MKRLDRYLVGRFLFAFVVGLGAVWIVFVVINLVERLDRFIDRGAAFGEVVLYYVYYSPWVILLAMPIAMLLAALFSVGYLARRHELLAMRAAGVSLWRICAPLLAIGIFMSGSAFAFGEMVWPKAEQARDAIGRKYLASNPNRGGIILANHIAGGRDGRVFYFRSFNLKSAVGEGVLVQTMDGGRVRSTLECRTLRFEDSVWVAIDGRIRYFNPNSEPSSESTSANFDAFERRAMPEWEEKPEELIRQHVDPNRMGYWELKSAITFMQKTGVDATAARTDLLYKLSFPLLNFVVVLFGVPVAARTGDRGMALNFMIALAVTIFFRVIIEVFRSLGKEGTVTPSVAAWTPIAVFLILGVVMLFRARR